MSRDANTLFELGAGDLQTLLRTEKVSTVDVVSSCLQRIADRGEMTSVAPHPVCYIVLQQNLAASPNSGGFGTSVTLPR
jgi:hypothetical protein